MRFGSEQITFNLTHPTGLSPCIEQCSAVSLVDMCVADIYAEEVVISEARIAKEHESNVAEQYHYAIYQIADETEPNSEESSEPDEELKPLPSHLKYAFLGKRRKFPVIISNKLTEDQIEKLLSLLRKYRAVIGYSILDMKGISLEICTHRIYLEENSRPTREPQRKLNPNLQEVVKKEILKLLSADIIYPISDSEWVSPIHVVPKKGGVTVVECENGEAIATRPVTGWRVCTDFRKLNSATRKDHFPLPFIDQILERLAGHKYFCYLDGYSGFLQVLVHPNDQDKTTFTCPYGTLAYRRLPFGLCNCGIPQNHY